MEDNNRVTGDRLTIECICKKCGSTFIHVGKYRVSKCPDCLGISSKYKRGARSTFNRVGVCQICDKEYIKRVPQQKTCSSLCRQELIRSQNSTYFKQYYAKHKTELLEQSKLWHAHNKDHCNELQHNYNLEYKLVKNKNFALNKMCPYCKTIFRTASDIKFYCSNECRLKDRYRQAGR